MSTPTRVIFLALPPLHGELPVPPLDLADVRGACAELRGGCERCGCQMLLCPGARSLAWLRRSAGAETRVS
jgi:hypothetical protein